MKIWVTKYALAKGILVGRVEKTSDYTVECKCLYDSQGKAIELLFGYFHGKGKDWHDSPDSALERAMVMKSKKINSLMKQIKRLQKLTFTVPE